MVPAGVIELDETHVALGQAPGEQAVGREGAGLGGLRTVQIEDALRFLRDVGHFRHARLHAIGHLVLGDARFDFGVEFGGERQLVEGADLLEHGPPAALADAVGVGEVKNGVVARGETHALVPRVEEAVAPQPRVDRLVGLLARHQHDEVGQVAVHRSQAVADPRPERRPAGNLRAGLEKGHRRVVVDGLGPHRFDEAQVIDDARGVREQAADGRARLAVLRELEMRAGQRQDGLVCAHGGEALLAADLGRQRLAVLLAQPRLVIEEVQVGRPAAHEQVDDAFGLGRKMRQTRQPAGRLRRQRRLNRPRQQRRQRGRTQTQCRP